MSRTTQRDVESAFRVFVDHMRSAGINVEGYALGRWAPGDGMARWRVESEGGSVAPLGSRYRSTSEMESALRLAAEALSIVLNVHDGLTR